MKDYKKRLDLIFNFICDIDTLVQDDKNISKKLINGKNIRTLITDIIICTDVEEKRVDEEWIRRTK